jgi:hypothetical protein
MSRQGVIRVAKIFSEMQEVRINLLDGDKQDIELGQLLERGKEVMKGDFCKITMTTAKEKGK